MTKLRESRLGVATYMIGQLKQSCLDRIPELGEVKLMRDGGVKARAWILGLLLVGPSIT